ncbi:DNA-3-methyladenine glycosylase 2 family protein [Sedimenticola hydrogenitrophicus]|uniref:DNA-3-methyladenine glycosylase 2 family protein n=1 Tax=Sedimenticola hydrogenitrophicus TaxID=2967975 RepID=UPI0023B1A43A|nr:DNA-3-methyladenine glycosylase 2 family protein [Sedimenticola hydrogenitrophicus]
MELDLTTCEQARQTRDPRFDGRFYVGVKSTGIYCRPICPARLPKVENITFFRSAAAASEAGFRPCLRCRPEAAPGTPAWHGTSTTVTRALRLIQEGALDQSSVSALADRLGITSRHLGRLFRRHLGAPPLAVAKTRRLQFAKKLINETGLSMTEVAMAAGYGSVRRFNDHFRQVYGRPPSVLRAGAGPAAGDPLVIHLPYRAPYCWESIAAFLAKRAVPGVEWVSDGAWHRHIALDGQVGHIEVNDHPTEQALVCRLTLPSTAALYSLVERLRILFDLNADPREIDGTLSRDPVLQRLQHEHPGIRVPGGWDGFELAVRAIVGQQISVIGATTVMGRIAARFGERSGDVTLFPTPRQLMRAAPTDLPMPQARARAIIELAGAVTGGTVNLDRWVEADSLRESLIAIKGIGEWTAGYIALRVLSDPDAFLHSDLVLLKVAQRLYGDRNAAALLERSADWRPWRAYAGMHLWRAAAQLNG